MAFLLGCEKVRVEFPTKTVFEGVSLGVDEGDRIDAALRADAARNSAAPAAESAADAEPDPDEDDGEQE